MNPDDIMLKKPEKKEALDTCLVEKSLMDKVVDLFGIKNVVKKFSKIRPFVKTCNLANPTNDPDYDGEGVNKAVVAGIKISF